MGAAAVPGVLAAEKKFPKGKAEHCIFIWLGGGACQIDTWDPKRLGDPKTKKAGSAYPAIETAVPGVQVCEHLKGCAKLLDRFVLMRTVNHNVVDEHAAATNRMHTGRPTSGTIVYPSIGSVVAHERGKANAGMPSYVVMGYPNLTRGPGFLGAKHGYIYLTDTKAGPEGLARPRDITSARMSDRERLLEKVRGEFLKRNPRDKAVRSYDVTIDEALALGRGEFKSAFDLKAESAGLRNSYGDEFGQRCLLARRLVQRGVRFIEVSFNLNFINGTGWDTHNQGQENQHILIQQLDAALATLVADLEKNKLLDKTLIVVSTEFGRPAQFDGGGGRGHHPGSFTVALAGGGLKTGQAVGVTDDLGMKIVEQPISVPNFFATIHCALGINPHKNLYAGDRPVPVTDHGEPVREVFA
ncbi:MAG: DUF1501 domain-containing protein [Verrucomicrobiota bacterium]|nr:DUF1501 domain-containing protein [Verrucomicrobiota bacterium]